MGATGPVITFMPFDRITDLTTLEAGWERVRRNGGSAGGDGQTLADFADGAAVRLIRLQRDLRLGTYVPGPVRRVPVPKRSGGVRVLSIPGVVDRVAQTATALVLGPVLDGEMEDASFGYRPGRSVRQAVARVAAHRRAGYGWVVDGDIERYFDTVPHDRLLDRLSRSVADAATVDLVATWLDAAGGDGRGLPQGAPISPLLANLYLDDVDERIEAEGVRLVRFADDFLLMCRSEVAAGRARDRMAALLADLGLRLNPDKTRIVPFEQGFRFLGHLFVRSVVVQEVAADDDAPPPDAAALAQALAPRDDGALDDPADAGGPDGAAALRVLYAMEPGRRLVARDRAFVVEEEGAPVLALPEGRVDRIELGPGVETTAEALRLAAGSGTDVAFVDGHGATVARLEGRTGQRAARHLDQARHAIDPGLRLDLARRIVDGRIRNQRALLRRLNRTRKDGEVEAAALALNRILRKLPVADAVPVLMGHEGEAAAHYWPSIGRMLEHGWGLIVRRRRPPPDPVNLVVSFLATLLHRDMTVLAERHGLHPGFGVLHETQDHHQGCAADLVEEFRAPLVEGLAVYLFNNRILDADMFAPAGDGAVRIDAEGRRAVIRGYEAWLDRPIRSPRTGRSVAWRRLMDEQVLAFVAHVEGRDAYRPYVMDY